jgi:hypothetical protein
LGFLECRSWRDRTWMKLVCSCGSYIYDGKVLVFGGFSWCGGWCRTLIFLFNLIFFRLWWMDLGWICLCRAIKVLKIEEIVFYGKTQVLLLASTYYMWENWNVLLLHWSKSNHTSSNVKVHGWKRFWFLELKY